MTQADLDLLGDFVSDRISAEAFPRLQALLQASAPARRGLHGLSLVEETLGEIAVERYFNVRTPAKRPATLPLAGSLPASRGEGEAAWIAPNDGWQCDAASKALKVSSIGAAFLPFTPEPSHLYRLSVTMHVVEGGIGWGAIGFSTSANTRLATLDHAWMLQRHETKSQPNAAYAGPQTAGELRGGDRLAGEQVRTIVLDTTRARWKAYFLAGDDLIGECDLAPQPVTHVTLSVFPNTVAVFRGTKRGRSSFVKRAASPFRLFLLPRR